MVDQNYRGDSVDVVEILDLVVWTDEGAERVAELLHEGRLILVPGCFADADAIVKEHSRPLGDKPLVDVDTNQTAGPELQNQLLSLSSNSKEMTADNSGHFVIIDRPDVVVDAVSQVVRSARTKTPL